VGEHLPGMQGRPGRKKKHGQQRWGIEGSSKPGRFIPGEKGPGGGQMHCPITNLSLGGLGARRQGKSRELEIAQIPD